MYSIINIRQKKKLSKLVDEILIFFAKFESCKNYFVELSRSDDSFKYKETSVQWKDILTPRAQSEKVNTKKNHSLHSYQPSQDHGWYKIWRGKPQKPKDVKEIYTLKEFMEDKLIEDEGLNNSMA